MWIIGLIFDIESGNKTAITKHQKQKTMINVTNLETSKGNAAANQFSVRTEKGLYFQSYSSNIVFIPNDGTPIQLDERTWDYSKTTGKYRNMFLGETKKETEKKIASGKYILTNLN